ncbi:CynX/NimT family MFS transporter (plasmid) [Arthrobacter sp. UC242_113]|uniref:CynX/NimT family MFS transporter n=1 Tax=Arthrobacter sp. UC242_113 TaxID=3374550 RepID=UPI003756FB94
MGEHAITVVEPAKPPAESRTPTPVQVNASVLIAAILCAAFNLRPAAVALGAELGAVRVSLHLSGPAASFMTTLPLLCFALVGLASPWVARRFGLHRTLLASLFIMTAGQAARALTDSGLVFVLASVGALGGVAAANVLLPTLVKHHFPHRLGLLNAAYGVSLTIGVAAAGVVTAPVAALFTVDQGWRFGLGIWGLTAGLAVIPWLIVHRAIAKDADSSIKGGGRQGPAAGVRQLLRTRLGWIMAVFLGLQSIHAYAIFGWLPSVFVSAGLSAFDAGLLLGLTTIVGIPLAFLFPALAARRRRPVGLMIVTGSGMIAGYLGLLLVPETLPWLWAVLLSLSTVNFPVITTLIALRCRTTHGVSILSGFAQGAGYLLAAPGPFMVGVLHDVSGGWEAPLIFLILLVLPMTVMAVIATAPRTIEDELDRCLQCEGKLETGKDAGFGDGRIFARRSSRRRQLDEPRTTWASHNQLFCQIAGEKRAPTSRDESSSDDSH